MADKRRDGTWMPIDHYLVRDDRKVSAPKLTKLIAKGEIEATYHNGLYSILINDGSREILFKKPGNGKPRNGVKSPETTERYGWKFADNILAEYRTTLQGLIDAAKYAKISVETRTYQNRQMINFSRELEKALRAYPKEEQRPSS